MKRRIAIIFSCLLVCMCASAQYMVEIKPTKKVIHVNELGISPNTGVLDILQAMPELLDRSTGNFFDNFSIQVDGKDVGQSRDVVLAQTKLVEVDVIEISTSPTASEQKNGTGGVINIKMTPVTTEGVGGNVLFDASTDWAVAPSVLINYKKGKFTLRSSVMIEHWQNRQYKTNMLYTERERTEQIDTLDGGYCQETAKLHLQWNPTSQDEVKLFAWESFGNKHERTRSGLTDWINQEEDPNNGKLWREIRMVHADETHAHQLIAEAQLSYKHLYNKGGEFNVDATYSYTPSDNKEEKMSRHATSMEKIIGGDQLKKIEKNAYPQQAMAGISTKHLLIPAGSAHSLDMKIGANATYGFGTSYYAQMVTGDYFGRPDTTDSRTESLFVSPFVEWNYAYNGWYIQLGGRYNYYRDAQQDNKLPFSCTEDHTGTGNLSVMWQVKSHHNLRLVAAHNISRSLNMDKDGQLQSEISPYYNADLNYIFDWDNGTDYVTTNAGVEYVYVKHSNYDTGVLSGNLQLIYRHSIFSLVFASNVYGKRDVFVDGNLDRWRMFYNISITPVLSFRKQWTLSGKFLYNSEIYTPDVTYGDCLYAQLRLSKDIKNWNIHVQLNDIFDYDTYNTYRTDLGEKREQEDLYVRSLQVGFGYRF